MKNIKYIKPTIQEKKVVNVFFSSALFDFPGNNLLACICNDCYAGVSCHGCLSGPASQYCNCDCD